MAGFLAGIPPMVIGGSIISVVSLILHIVGFATTYWYWHNYNGSIIYHFGLWKSCQQLGEIQLCNYITDQHNNYLTAAEVIESLALGAFLAAQISALLKVFVLKKQRILFIVTGLLNFVAGALTLVGVIVFATMRLAGQIQLDGHFNFSFGLCIVGGIGGVCSGVVFILAWRWVKD
ncbi:uncharacterized protein LOC134691705 [Mytilus trossulus]|uniref:uncharacterized protein LOC134691705 n=1 Tax=Mytilus trossulus TaxID=6551 RepID=UPI003004A0E7